MVELHTDPNIERQKSQLKPQPEPLRILTVRAPNQLLPRNCDQLRRYRDSNARPTHTPRIRFCFRIHFSFRLAAYPPANYDFGHNSLNA
jgi:hypothetical protein